MNWIKRHLLTIGLVFAGIILVLNGRKASRLFERAKTAEDRADTLKNSQISGKLEQAQKFTDQAAKDKEAAQDAKQRMHDRLAQIGEADENINDVSTRFNGHRVRLKPGGAS